MQDVPAADGIAVHLGDDRLGNFADRAVQVADLQARRSRLVVIAALAADFLVAAGAEIALLAGQHHHADAVVVPGVVEGLQHFVDRARAEGVENPRAVHAHGRYAVCFCVDDVLESWHVLPHVHVC